MGADGILCILLCFCYYLFVLLQKLSFYDMSIHLHMLTIDIDTHIMFLD